MFTQKSNVLSREEMAMISGGAVLEAQCSWSCYYEGHQIATEGGYGSSCPITSADCPSWGGEQGEIITCECSYSPY